MACTPVVVAPPSLLAAFAAVPDPRRQASVDYPLPPVLALAVVAVLARQLSQLAPALGDRVGGSLRGCYACWAIKRTKRWSMRTVKASRWRPLSVAASRS
jgi:hypothetical protein